MAAGMVVPNSNSNCHDLDPTNPYCLFYDNGMMYQNSTVNMADITDGTSTTVIFGESLYLQGVWSQATSCCVRTNIDRTINKPIVVTGPTARPTTGPTGRANIPAGQFRLRRRHVRPVTQQINKLVLNKIMTRNGGETVSSDEIK